MILFYYALLTLTAGVIGTGLIYYTVFKAAIGKAEFMLGEADDYIYTQDTLIRKVSNDFEKLDKKYRDALKENAKLAKELKKYKHLGNP